MTASIIIFGLISGCFFSVLVGLVGSRRNIGFTWAFILSLLFTPIIGLLLTLLSSKKSANESNKYGCVGTVFGILGFVFLILCILAIVGIIVV
ncbi:MAG: hypothetical protein PHU62_10385 [Bacteroidales bacterium]|jgi:Na+/melibiose symporter-like transporter|nr:hypothetical protein [Bacteroidales bacterium]MDD2205696.1 hypothetical protein [Bacteroidales bacterium]MDD3915190.1 hypothetical protein [Bacteroidales bacterium]MDD4634955.1 hypothetical protein [Bacteroidales bacterium]